MIPSILLIYLLVCSDQLKGWYAIEDDGSGQVPVVAGAASEGGGGLGTGVYVPAVLEVGVVFITFLKL